MQIPNQLGEKKDDTKITRDEMKKIESAMKRPEFQELLGDYMKEISDPANREEYDQYLRQLESESELPKGLQLVKPEPHFCLKTSLWSKVNKKLVQKFFVNICATSVVGQPFSEDVVQNGQQGKSWKIPFTIEGDICNTVDVAFHPFAIGYTHKFPGFQNILCDTALDAAQKQLGERNEDISKDFKILKKTKCKGGEPALLPVRVDKKGKQTQAEQRQGGLNNAQTKLQKDIMGQQKDYQQEKAVKLKKGEEPVIEDEEEEEDIIQKESNEIESGAIQQPKFKYVYQYPVDYADFLDNRQQQVKKRPNVLGLDITLPRIKSAAEVSLDIAESTLVLDVPKRYYLNIKLPYPIISSEGTAKFDSKSRVLKIRAPINPSYLKERALEDVEEAKACMVTFIEEVAETKQDDSEESQTKENESKEGYAVTFLPSTITEVIEETAPAIADTKGPIKGETIYNKLSYMKSIDNVDGNNLYVMIKIKDYKADQLQYAVVDKDIILKRESKQESNTLIEFIHIKTPSFDTKKTKIQFVTDFIVIKLHQEQLWLKDELLQEEDYTSVPFTHFLDKLSELQQNLKDVQVEELEIPVAKEREVQQTEQPVQDEDDVSETQEKTDDKTDELTAPTRVEESSNDLGDSISIPYDKDKITINFIDFRSVVSLAFDID